jgi:3-methyladenine DNA glycosylase AlkD
MTDVDAVLDWLKRNGSAKARADMARYAIPSDQAFGVTVGALKKHAKRLGHDHQLALALWESGWYEARMLAAFVDEPKRVTAAQMNRWCRDFDSWAICDTVCFHLFDRTPHAWRKARQWTGQRDEFGKRAGFALLWSLAAHDRTAPDEVFLECLPLIEQGAGDERNFVKKGVDMALRAIGKRSQPLNHAAIKLARRLAESEPASARWVGRSALRELSAAVVRERLARPSMR